MSKYNKLILRLLISVGIVCAYLIIGNQLVQPDPKNIGWFALIFFGIIASALTGVGVLIFVIFYQHRRLINTILYLTTLIANTSAIYICLVMGNATFIFILIFYSALLIGLIQLYLFIKFNFVKETVLKS